MSNLSHRQLLIQEKRKITPWKGFLMEIASRCSLSLYRKNGFITRFPETDRVATMDREEYELVRDNFLESGMEYTWDFLSDFSKLFQATPFPMLFWGKWNENGDYADMGWHSKNVYLCFIYTNCENVCYNYNLKFSTDVYNSACIWDQSQIVYQSLGITKSFKVFYSKGIHDCNNMWFSVDCVGCSECIGCSGLINQSYCIENKIYEKNEYFQKKNEYLKHKQNFRDRFRQLPNVDIKVACEGVWRSHVVYNIKNGNNVVHSWGAAAKENFYDVVAWGILRDFYGVFQGTYFSEHVYCSAHINGSTSIFYSYNLSSCSFCLGCIWLKNKSYCILNKQYTKEERYEIVDEIFSQMERGGTLGEFFPGSMNPFYFNDTAAYLIDPSFTKEEVIAKWYLRRDEPIKVDIPEFMEKVRSTELNQFEKWENDIRTIDPSILKKVIIDEQWNSYRIIKMEYDFLVKYGLPLPRKHWLDRMKENFRIN